MKYSLTYTALTAAIAVTSVFAAPTEIQKRATCSSAVTLEGNPFASYKLFANDYYRAEVEAAAEAITDATLKAQALKVADVGTFKWIDTISVIPTIDEMIKSVPCEEIIGLVIYDLPGRDCAAKASNGELPVGSIDRYKSEYIDRTL